MISHDRDATSVVNQLLRQIKIKENQLKIAQDSNMLYVAQALETQLLELRSQLSEPPDLEFQALMSLLDD
ncbi:hypothetical protein ACN23B_16335 [Anabaena sp. FACHB-709]|uniref:Uncharacterized protein n=2 Tax=Nostocaceae TaxID=1162 RepID=A0A1Z4KIV6_ANAVA|nr:MULTISPECIES: hypothetical protein [Nostocaceae]BAY68877.1 hypothetical protein NIES23_16670 [Trichormus variabilis NIES-23]HBW31563.1 hypothetical protein [Nostoc sp. UBA8866]MBD2170454.1 hypothetical protein [Anabaena cylindrica FACHB-318]MBD2262070.1 hypothetical protein [Anabaena sp. FACHB-709]MBD2271786.1 hypothetical protein [Nostoc sp. PCC 7120 = FACHB-418]